MRKALRALIVAATTAGALSLPATAQAATIYSLDCVATTAHSLTCTLSALVQQPYYINWYRDALHGPFWDNDFTVTMFCRVAPVVIDVRVVVGDSLGEAEATAEGLCGIVP
jgi:hypothetical protein